jgi:hypothetical protein
MFVEFGPEDVPVSFDVMATVTVRFLMAFDPDRWPSLITDQFPVPGQAATWGSLQALYR